MTVSLTVSGAVSGSVSGAMWMAMSGALSGAMWKELMAVSVTVSVTVSGTVSLNVSGGPVADRVTVGLRDRACMLEADLRDARANLREAQEACGRRGHDWSGAVHAPREGPRWVRRCMACGVWQESFQSARPSCAGDWTRTTYGGAGREW